MLDTHARKYVNPIIELGAEFLLKLKLTPNNVTILALLLGVSTSIFLYFWFNNDFIHLYKYFSPFQLTIATETNSFI